MHKITLIFSGHRENGICNVDALLEILRAIEPEVVFEEFRPTEFDSLYEHGNLEAHALKKYRDFKSFKQVSVDRYDMPKNLTVEMRRVFACVEQSSQEYLELMEIENFNVRQYGFRYLNSPICEKLSARLSEIEDRTIIGTGDQELIRGLESWRCLTQRRELEMVGNIYEYSKENVFDFGVFLVGASHKTGILKEIKKYAATGVNAINWIFAFGQNP